MQVNTELKNGMCNHCGYSFLVDDEVKRVSIVEGEQAGYDFERGREKAQKERAEQIKAEVSKQWEYHKTNTVIPIIVLIIIIILIGLVVPGLMDKEEKRMQRWRESGAIYETHRTSF